MKHRKVHKMNYQDDGIVPAPETPPFQDNRSGDEAGIGTSDIHASLASMQSPTKSEASRFFGSDPMLSPSIRDNVTLEVSLPNPKNPAVSRRTRNSMNISPTREHEYAVSFPPCY